MQLFAGGLSAPSAGVRLRAGNQRLMVSCPAAPRPSFRAQPRNPGKRTAHRSVPRAPARWLPSVRRPLPGSAMASMCEQRPVAGGVCGAIGFAQRAHPGFLGSADCARNDGRGDYSRAPPTGLARRVREDRILTDRRAGLRITSCRGGWGTALLSPASLISTPRARAVPCV